MCRTHYTYESGREDITTLYLVPVAPGVTRAYNKVVLKNVASRTKSIFNFLSKTVLSSGFFHAFGHGLVDQVCIPRAQKPVNVLLCKVHTSPHCSACAMIGGTQTRTYALSAQDLAGEHGSQDIVPFLAPRAIESQIYEKGSCLSGD